MDLTLNRKYKIARSLLRGFAGNEVKPLAQGVDEEERFPVETIERVARYGSPGIPVPEEYDSRDCDVLIYTVCIEGLSKVCGTTGAIISAHTSLCIDPILTYNTEEQKQEYLSDLASGKKLDTLGLTEPNAGADAQSQQTKTVLGGDKWILNGSKCLIVSGKYADVYVVIAVTGTVERYGKRVKEISAFIVERGTPSFTFGVKERKMGIRASATYELIFQDRHIPKDAMLGQKGKGFHVAVCTLNGGRIGITSQTLGLAEDALERTVAYVEEKEQFGRAIVTFRNTQFQLTDMATNCKATQLLIYKVAVVKQTQTAYDVEAAKIKLFAANTAMSVTTKCMRLHSDYGYIRECDVECMMRDVEIMEIYEDTSEVQRMVISASLLK